MRPSGTRTAFALHRAFGRAALAVIAIAGWIAIAPPGSSHAATPTPDAVTLLQKSLTTMQRSIHSLHAAERMSIVLVDGSSTTETFSADCATTPISLLAGFHETITPSGPQSGVVQTGKGHGTWDPTTFVDGVWDTVVRWESGAQPTAWFRSIGGQNGSRLWQKQTGGLSDGLATQAGFLCPGSPLFRNPCSSSACPSNPGPIIPANLTNWGTEVLRGTTVWVLESAVTTSNGGATATVVTDFYVAHSSLRLLRYVRSEFDTFADPAAGQGRSWLDVFNYSAFNKPVTIKIPKIAP